MNHPDQSSLRSPAARSSVFALKAEAQALQDKAKQAGDKLTRSEALEKVARSHGFLDWNAARAAALAADAVSAPDGTNFDFQRVDRELPIQVLSILQLSDKRAAALSELHRWARQLDFVAEKVAATDRHEALGLIGGDVPYVFVQDRARWADDLYHLCDRGYDSIRKLALPRKVLESVGVIAWDALIEGHGGPDMYSVIHDEVIGSKDPTRLKMAARLLISLAQAFEQQLLQSNQAA